MRNAPDSLAEDRYSAAAIDALLADTDWSSTALGARETWPQALEHAIGICLHAYYPTFIYWGAELTQFYNAAGAQLCGERHPAVFGAPMMQTWSDLWPIIGPQLRHVQRTGETVVSNSSIFPKTARKHPWEDRSFTYAYSPIYVDGLIAGVMEVSIDTTDALRQGRQINALVEERTIVADASRLLFETLDIHQALENVGKSLIPRFGDWCQIDLLTRTGTIMTAAIVHPDAEKMNTCRHLVGRVHLDANAEHGSAYAMRTGKVDIIPELSVEMLERAVVEAAEVEIYLQLGVRSVISVPIMTGNEIFGALNLVYSDSGRTYTANDVPVLQELALRMGLAVRNAQRFRREQRAAESFQEASLPHELPRVHGLSFDAIYEAAHSDGIVGGDWYDAVRLFDGRVVISIGDVAGNGLRAAVTMGNMRQIIRGIAQVHADPALMLNAADRALRLEHPDVQVTAFVGVLDPIAHTLAYASAGHPPPMLRHADGTIVALSDGGLPLGLRDGGDGGGMSCDFEPGSRLVLYTDGLTEYARDPLAGEEQLRRILQDAAVFDVVHPAARIREVFLDGASTNDDIAVLVVSAVEEHVAPGLAPFKEWYFDVVDYDAAQAARRGFCEIMQARGADGDSIAAAEIVFGELIGNVLRYAPGPVRVVVDWASTSPVLHVIDYGPGYRHIAVLPSDIYAESGRGLFMVSALTKDFNVAKNFNGGSHARAVLTVRQSRM